LATLSFPSIDLFAQDGQTAWMSYDTTQSDIDTAANGAPAQYIQQFNLSQVERQPDSHCYVWIRTVALSAEHALTWREHDMRADVLFSNYNYAACRIEIDCKEDKYRTWQWMYYDDHDNPVSGLKLNHERPMSWYPLTPSLKKIVQKLGI